MCVLSYFYFTFYDLLLQIDLQHEWERKRGALLSEADGLFIGAVLEDATHAHGDDVWQSSLRFLRWNLVFVFTISFHDTSLLCTLMSGKNLKKIEPFGQGRIDDQFVGHENGWSLFKLYSFLRLYENSISTI